MLHVENLQIEIQNGRTVTPAVKGVSFQLQRGKVLALIGESGCGKSLTCLSIMNLLPEKIRKSHGKIQLKGKRIDSLNKKQSRLFRGKGAAIIMQNPMSAFDPLYTIRNHFTETFAAHHAEFSIQTAESLLADMGFPDPRAILRLYPFQLSGGMLQRVMIALALVHRAPLLIADEPVTALDVTSQSLILELIDRQRKEAETGVILVTHDLGVVARMADHVAVMQNGRLVETAPVMEIFHNPQHPHTRELLDAHLTLHGERKDKWHSLN